MPVIMFLLTTWLYISLAIGIVTGLGYFYWWNLCRPACRAQGRPSGHRRRGLDHRAVEGRRRRDGRALRHAQRGRQGLGRQATDLGKIIAKALLPTEVPPIAGLLQPGDGRSAKTTIQPHMTTIGPAATEPRVAGRG